MNRFHLTSAQRKSSAVLCILTSVGLFITAGILASSASDMDTATVLITVVLGVTIGVLVRTSAKRGWNYSNETNGRRAAFSWTMARRFGLAWRAVGLLFAGRVLINVLDQMAWSDLSQAFLMAFALLAITGAAILVGLFFGWKQAEGQGAGAAQPAQQ
jgi:membrane protein DedA with SNARE-associated domain